MYSITIKYYCKIGYFSLEIMLSIGQGLVWLVKCLDRGGSDCDSNKYTYEGILKRKFG